MGPSARVGGVRGENEELYRGARKRAEECQVLDQVCVTLKRCRRSAKRLMRRPPAETPMRQREPIYSERLIRVLEAIWEAGHHPWSVRLKEVLPLWMPWIRKRFDLTPAEERQLLSMSPATIDRRLAAYKRKRSRKIYGKTKPGRWLRQTIPIQTESWNVPDPGWMEVDTVSHSGQSAEGLLAYTVNQTDLFSGWTECRATLGKDAAEVAGAIDEMRQGAPFETQGARQRQWRGVHQLASGHATARRRTSWFRSRPYKKDDQAHIEQKNWTHVRKLIGWDRYDTQAAVDAMNDLYRNEWRLFCNMYLPSVKLDKKIRVGSKIKRIYHKAKTPLDRLLESDHGDRVKLEVLRRLREKLDPFELSKVVDRKLQAIWKLASQGGPIKPAPRRTFLRRYCRGSVGWSPRT